jgi:alkanesulfonate monooxygenase SsuD/methylene tetrahydromethanopterin reductase-like flavin-dependent oxidoreductase (luciferase family)
MTNFKLGFFSYLQGTAPISQIYAETMTIFKRADELGFDTAWVAQHHFGGGHGNLPSPFVFFGALGGQTKQIGFGTAVVTLPLENPVRVAEDAAVLETLFPGRLQLGLGTGFATPEVMAAFGLDGSKKRELYDRGVERLIETLEGRGLNEQGDNIVPIAPDLRNRLYESPSVPAKLSETAARGTGLLLSRVAIGMGLTPTYEVQVPMVEQLKRELPPGVEPRIGMSRTVYPSRNPESAWRNMSNGIQHAVDSRKHLNLAEDKLKMDEAFRHYNIHWGTTEQVIESLAKEPLIDEITELICQVQPGVPTLEQTLEAIELIATEVAPALGWIPAHQRDAVAV